MSLDQIKEASKVSVVQSKAGHDKGELFCVMAREGNFLFLANGRQRRLSMPKRKKLDHVEFLSHSTEEEITFPSSDKELRRALAAFKEVITLGKR